MARKSGLPFLTFPPPYSTPRSHPPVAVAVVVEADGPLVVAVTVVVVPTATALLVLTRLPPVRQPKAQSRHLESEDATSLALDALLLSQLSQDAPQALMPVLQLTLVRLLKLAVELATEKRMPPVSR
jgi:hypothetical protein